MPRRAGTSGIGGIPRVNLMPRAELDRRARAAVLRAWGWALVGTAGVVLLVAAAGYSLDLVAHQQLEAEQDRTDALLAELTSLAPVSIDVTTEADLELFRSQAMAADIDWVDVYGTLAAALPAGVTMTGFDLSVGGVPLGVADGAAQVGMEGEITFDSATPADMGALIRAYRGIPGIVEADGTEVAATAAAGAAAYAYRVSVTFDQSIYTGVFSTEGGP